MVNDSAAFVFMNDHIVSRSRAELYRHVWSFMRGVGGVSFQSILQQIGNTTSSHKSMQLYENPSTPTMIQ